MTRLTQTHDYLPPITCTPWCAQGDGHAQDIFTADQTCFGDEHRVPLIDTVKSRGGESLQSWLTTYATQVGFEGPTRIAIGRGDDEVWYVRLEEAYAFARAILVVCVDATKQ